MDNNEEIIEKKKQIRVFVCGNWASSEHLCRHFNKQSQGDFTWNNIRIVSELPADYYVVFNKFDKDQLDLSKTILFRMEPYMESNFGYHGGDWGWWCSPPKELFLFAGYHEDHYNNIEFHVSKTYDQLMTEKIQKTVCDVMSSVVSCKYQDVGHRKRIDFLKFVEHKGLIVDTFGSNAYNWRRYKGSPPSHCKDEALFPYKYTFNVENNCIHNYVTEKLVDGIVAECLTFYNGPKNIGDIIDGGAYVYLELEDFQHDFEMIKKMIEEDEWSKRIDTIRREKVRILNELQFMPRICKIINDDINSKHVSDTQ